MPPIGAPLFLQFRESWNLFVKEKSNFPPKKTTTKHKSLFILQFWKNFYNKVQISSIIWWIIWINQPVITQKCRSLKCLLVDANAGNGRKLLLCGINVVVQRHAWLHFHVSMCTSYSITLWYFHCVCNVSSVTAVKRLTRLHWHFNEWITNTQRTAAPAPLPLPSFRASSLFCCGRTDNDEKTRRKNCTWQSDSTIPLICALQRLLFFQFWTSSVSLPAFHSLLAGLRNRLAGLLFLIQKGKKEGGGLWKVWPPLTASPLAVTWSRCCCFLLFLSKSTVVPHCYCDIFCLCSLFRKHFTLYFVLSSYFLFQMHPQESNVP